MTLYPDGKYRWVYEVPMLKNPSILFDVYWVLGISFGLVWLFNVLLIGCEGDLSLESLWDFSSVFLILMLVFAVIGYVAYVIVAWTYGWKYVVLFTLDGKGVKHEQMPRQVKKAQVLGASRSSSTSTLANVARLIPCRRMNLIKVNQLFTPSRMPHSI